MEEELSEGVEEVSGEPQVDRVEEQEGLSTAETTLADEPQPDVQPTPKLVLEGSPAPHPPPPLAHAIEALLFLSSDPLSPQELADAALVGEEEVAAALVLLGEQYAPGQRGLRLRELAGGYTLATDPATEEAARRLFSRPRAFNLTPAQAETLAIVAYLQPVSRPEITRIRGVSADSAATILLERGLIEEAGRSQFGAVLYRTGTLFLKLFGLGSLEELPDVAQWDPTPEEAAELRERLLRAGEARAGGGPGAALEE
jgi:segregation and condensation protein B